MIFLMMVQVDFDSIAGVRRQPKGLVITTTVNWLIKPLHHVRHCLVLPCWWSSSR